MDGQKRDEIWTSSKFFFALEFISVSDSSLESDRYLKHSMGLVFLQS